MARIVFLSCHLSGTGHLVRTLALARAALRAGHGTWLISGGRPLSHVEADDVALIQLPPVTIRGLEFGQLRTPDGAAADGAYMDARRERLVSELDRLAPDVLVTELFPFGRRMLADEFLAAILAARTARPGVRVVASVRDIPEPKPRRLAECAARLDKYYDGVLVHGDRDFLPLETTWPMPARLAPKIHHVGYVGAPLPPAGTPGKTVLVSGGGGVLGRAVLALAAAAAASSRHDWQILVGGSDAAEVVERIGAAHARPNLSIHTARPDYRRRLVDAGCSVSLCGYNTAVDVARISTPAILIPSEEGGEQEQLLRARRLARTPGVRLFRLDGLAPEMLAGAADAMVGRRRLPLDLRIDDGARAIACIEGILKEPAR